MFIITIIIVASGLIVALALAASASRSGTVDGDVLHEDEHIRPINMAPKPFTTSHQGIATDARSVISAAGLQ